MDVYIYTLMVEVTFKTFSNYYIELMENITVSTKATGHRFEFKS